MKGQSAMPPNDPKLSDRGGRRSLCGRRRLGVEAWRQVWSRGRWRAGWWTEHRL